VSVVEDLDPAAPLIDWVATVHGIDAETEIDGTSTYVSGDWPRVIRGISTDLQGGVYLSGSFFGRIWIGETPGGRRRPRFRCCRHSHHPELRNQRGRSGVDHILTTLSPQEVAPWRS
jgi:hypothetical protein